MDLDKLKANLLSVASPRLQKQTGVRIKRKAGHLDRWEYRYRLRLNLAVLRRADPTFVPPTEEEMEDMLRRAMGDDEYEGEARSRKRMKELIDGNDNTRAPKPEPEPQPEPEPEPDPEFPELLAELPTFSEIRRPDDYASDDEPLLFMNVDVDYGFGPKNRRFFRDAVVSGWVPVVRIFGCTADGRSVCAFVHGFLPYFFCSVGNDPFPQGELERVLAEKAGYVWTYDDREGRSVFARNGRPKKEVFVHSVERISARDVYGYNGEDAYEDFFKITLVRPQHVPVARDWLVERWPGVGLYECNVDFVVRFMVDLGVAGFSWIELVPGTYASADDGAAATDCGIEVHVGFGDLIAHRPDEDARWSDLAPVRILSFDIECKTSKRGLFPDATRPGDRVIQIANLVTTYGSTATPYRVVLCYGSSPSSKEVPTICFPDEDSLMAAWRELVRVADPDILTVISLAFSKNRSTGNRPFIKLHVLQHGTTLSWL